MNIAELVDELIKLFEHLGPCVALLLVLHRQNYNMLNEIRAYANHLHSHLDPDDLTECVKKRRVPRPAGD
jgi:hypothetical protein